MAPLMILNPRKKGGKKKRRKMTAKQLKFFGPRKGKKKKRRAKTITINANPKGRTHVAKKKRHKRRKAKIFASNPRPKRRHFRRNPRIPGAGIMRNTLVPAAIGAAGALGVDILLGNIPMSPQMRQGPMLPLVKIGFALLIGMAVGSMSNTEAGEEAAAGAVTVTLYGITKGWMLRRMPNMRMARYAPMNGVGRFVNMNGGPPGQMHRPGGGGNMRGVGYVNPARVGNAAPDRAQMRFMSTR